MSERLAMMREWFRTVWTTPLGELTLVDLGLLAGLGYVLLGSVRLVGWMLDDWQRAREWRRATRTSQRIDAETSTFLVDKVRSEVLQGNQEDREIDQHHSRRWLITSTLLALVAHVMFALHYAFDLFGLASEAQKPTAGTLNATLEPLTLVATGVVGAEGHAAGCASASAYSLAAETGSFTLTGGAVSMRVSGV